MGTRNKLSDLNNHLFEVLERLSDDELMEKDLDKEVTRAKAINTVAKTVVENARLVFDVAKHAEEYGYKREVPKILRLEDDSE